MFLISCFIFLVNYLEVELLDHMVVYFQLFLGTSILFNTAILYQFTIPLTVYGGSYSTISSLILIICHSNNSHSDRCEMIYHHRFVFI